MQIIFLKINGTNAYQNLLRRLFLVSHLFIFSKNIAKFKYKMKKSLSLICVLFLCFSTFLGFSKTNNFDKKFHGLIENKGQIIDQFMNPRLDIDFTMRTNDNLSIFIGNGIVQYQFFEPVQDFNSANNPIERESQKNGQTIDLYRLDVQLVGCNKEAKVEVSQKGNYVENFYCSYLNKSRVSASSYSRIVYRNIYSKIDWIITVKNGELKHEFFVHKGGDARDIKIKYAGHTSLDIDDIGRLIAETPMGKIVENAPVSFDMNQNIIPTFYNLRDDILTYEVEKAINGDFIIDPKIDWGTYIGGVNDEQLYNIGSDRLGFSYVAGRTTSSSHIATVGAFKTTLSGGYDAFVSKFNDSGSLLWSTYYGGSGDEYVSGLALDKKGNIIISGSTQSPTGIATSGSFRDTISGLIDAFVSKFDNSGNLLWGTYFGGANNEPQGFQKVTVDTFMNIYLGGITASTSLISSVGSYQYTYGGGEYDGFLAKFDMNGNYRWSTYYGGPGDDRIQGIATSLSGNIYLTGRTNSLMGLTTSGSHISVAKGNDAFLSKFDSTGNLGWGTYICKDSSGGEQAYGVAVDKLENIFVVGSTTSRKGFATPGAFKTSYSGGCSDVFICKFNANDSLLWATYYGGKYCDAAMDIAVDNYGKLFITGFTYSSTGISTPGSYKDSFSGLGGGAYCDGYLAMFTDSGILEYATYFGDTLNDFSYSISANRAGDVFIGGNTQSKSKISTSGAYQTTLAGGYDAFLMKFNVCDADTLGAIVGPDTIQVGIPFTYTNSTLGGIWSLSSNIFASVDKVTGVVTGASVGTDTLKYTYENNCGKTTVITKLVYVSNSLSISENNGKDFQIYPNPTSNRLMITGNEIIESIEIFDLIGNKVMQKTCNGKCLEIDLGFLSSGVYLMKMNSTKICFVTKI